MAFVVLYDACVLYPAPLRDLLVRFANTGIVRARWSEMILDECFRNILEQRPELRPEALARTRELMKRAVPDCIVTGFEGLVDSVVLPDPDDRHVLAAAIRAGAQTIVTFNLRDFPDERLAPYNIEARHHDPAKPKAGLLNARREACVPSCPTSLSSPSSFRPSLRS
ncbi:MAG: PIN domain-containing protein [Deltaproteobacteria bacterium]|nr:PIN domain-containing protein [Deltaproteobacteria bacterium]